jgi:hypothetical protein
VSPLDAQNKILIDNNLQNFGIKYNNITYYYTFLFTTRYVETILKNRFHNNIYFGIEYDEPSLNKNENKSNFIVLYILCGIMFLIIIIFAIYKIQSIYNNCKEEKEHEKELLSPKKGKTINYEQNYDFNILENEKIEKERERGERDRYKKMKE